MQGDASYLRVAAALRRRIQSGELAPGAPIPSKRDLARLYGVAPTVAQEAVHVLRREGLVAGLPRRRLVVAHPPVVRMFPTLDPDDAQDGNLQRRERRPAPAAVAERLGVSVDFPIELELWEHSDPVTQWPSYLRIRYTVPDRTDTAVSRTIAVAGRAAVEGEAILLGMAIGAMLLVVEVTRYADGGRPVEAVDLLLPVDRWKFPVEYG